MSRNQCPCCSLSFQFSVYSLLVVNARDSEIERLNNLLSDGRPIMSRNQCPCCSPQLLDCRLLAKNKELCDQLEESKQKQHEAMVKAVELAERNQLLENRNITSARSNTSQGSKRCCCAENSNKICKLQEKLEERILQVEKLEQELSELRKAHSDLRSDKMSVDKILEITLEDKKKMNDRVNELTMIEHDLMLEIERLKRTNATQKSQLAELEAQVQMPGPTNTGGRAKTAKPTYGGTSRTQDVRRPAQPVHKKVTISKPTPVPPKPSRVPPKKPSARVPETTTDTSTLSSSGPARAVPPPSISTSPSPPPDLRDQLTRERRQFQQQLEDLERQQAEHCAKFHPPACPRSTRGESANEADGQWLLLERVQAERDYYHKEFSRLRDQLCNIPDHSAELQASTGPSSPHQKLERLLTERDYYHKEMCRLLDILNKTQSSQSAISQHWTILPTSEARAVVDREGLLPQGDVSSARHPKQDTVKSASTEPSSSHQKLETLLTERDYYHKLQASTGPSSPHQKLERLLTERDYYHKEMCRLLDILNKTRSSQSAIIAGQHWTILPTSEAREVVDREGLLPQGDVSSARHPKQDTVKSASTEPSSSHQKLERFLTERDNYHKEMCRLLDILNKTQSSQSAISMKL
ncbi:centrosomal protein of 135 kDa-like [Macrosteles quadrilineatus]|uniref:centrosomal protein of 135 kDa-like n=1 Tax=Macrosteles quadrilineatus TaxID=74068 RepID=UPI0023E29999|nr:centrosomal protein of 135 kDa-like [Macrosteles quadrilineatus]